MKRGGADMLRDKKGNGFWYRRRYSLFFFLYLIFYHVFIVNRLEPWKLNEVTYVQYCVDFSYGFGSKLLPGAIFNLLFGKYASRTTANIYAVAVVILFFTGLSLLLERFMERIRPADRRAAVFVLLFFLSGSYTFCIFTKWVGILDTAWLPLLLLFIVILEHRCVRFLLPLLFALALMIHFSALVFCIPVFAILLLYRGAVARDKRERRGILAIFAASMAVTAGAFLFLILNESKTVCPIEEFHNKLLEHGADYFTYHDYAFFHIWNGESFIPDGVSEIKPFYLKFIYFVYYQIKLDYDLFAMDVQHGLLTALGGLAVLLPCLCFILPVFWRRMRRKGDGLQRFCAFLMLIQFPFVFLMAVLFAIGLDATRYLTHGFLGLFTLLLTVLYYEEDQRTAFFERIGSVCDTSPAMLYFLAYAAITLGPI